jgi:hypothetical protein
MAAASGNLSKNLNEFAFKLYKKLGSDNKSKIEFI